MHISNKFSHAYHYFMMFVQIFEAGIEDEFAWENIGRNRREDGRTTRLFQSGIPTIFITQAELRSVEI